MSDAEILSSINALYDQALVGFLRESLMIEGIHCGPTSKEILATRCFLDLKEITTKDVCALQRVYAPGMPLRTKKGLNVYVGNYAAPPGGPAIRKALNELCETINRCDVTPWHGHVAFEKLHPFLDGNGRTGRAVWAWQMEQLCERPFSLGFLHRFYYQTLANTDRR
jgi:Fic family protein